jgi:EmrB/QacA subfamily drug resistance transporter
MAEANPSSKSTWVLVLASIANLMGALDAMVVTTALVRIGRDFGASIETLEWTVNAYTLSFAAFFLLAAALGDRFGRRRMFVAGLLLFAAASAACAVAPGIGWLIAARAVQGVGAALVMPLALAQISLAFPPERRGWALGIYSSTAGLSTVLGPTIGGVVTQGLAWPWIFWMNVPIGIVVAMLARAKLSETFGARAPLDLLGVALSTAGAFGIVWGLVRGNAAGWTSAEVVGGLGGGALLMVLFVLWELRTLYPMIPMRFFKSRMFSAGNAAMFFLTGTLLTAIFFMAQFLQAGLGFDPLVTGLGLLPWGAAVIVGGRSAVAVARRLGDAQTIAAALFAQAVGLGWIALLARPGIAYAELIGPMLLAGLGFALAVTNAQKVVVGAVALADIGKASGTLGTLRQLGGAFGVAIAVAAFARAGSYATPDAFSRGFAAAMAVAALLSLMGALSALALLWPGSRTAGSATGAAVLSGSAERA